MFRISREPWHERESGVTGGAPEACYQSGRHEARFCFLVVYALIAAPYPYQPSPIWSAEAGNIVVADQEAGP
jgi:hypothetical protein